MPTKTFLNLCLVLEVVALTSQVTAFTGQSGLVRFGKHGRSRLLASVLAAHKVLDNDIIGGPEDVAPVVRNPLKEGSFFDQDMSHSAAGSEEKNRRAANSSLDTWMRRLNTKQDRFDIHKWAGFGWWVSSTAIFGTGTLSGFTQVPPVLENYTYLFMIATIAQSISSVPMAIKYRSNEPAVQRGFISSAITTTSLAVTGYWLSPFVTEKILVNPSVMVTVIGALVLVDVIYNMTAFQDLKDLLVSMFKEIDLNNPAEKAFSTRQKISTFLSTLPFGMVMNLILLSQMLGHDHARDYVASVVIEHGSSLDLVYYASMVTSIAASVGNLGELFWQVVS